MNLTKRNRRPAALAALLLAASVLMGGCGQVKMGYIDSARVVEKSPQLQAVVEEGNKKLEEIQAQADEEYAKNPNASMEELQQIQTDTQRKLSSISQAYATQLRQKLDVAVSEIVREKQLDAVMDSSENQKAVVLGGIDLTDEVIQKLQ